MLRCAACRPLILLAGLSLMALLALPPGAAAQQESKPPESQQDAETAPPADDQGEPSEPADDQQPTEPEGAKPVNDAAAPEPAALDVTDIAPAAENAEATLETLTESLKADSPLDKIRADAEGWEAMLPQELATVRSLLESTNSISGVAELRLIWSGTARDIDAAQTLVDERAGIIKQSLEQVDGLQATWEQTAADLPADAPEAATQQVQVVLASIQEAREAIRQRRDALVTLQTRLASLDLTVEKTLKDISEATARLQKGLLTVDAPPLWTVLLTDGLEFSAAPIVEEWQRRLQGLADYVARQQAVLGLQGLIVLAGIMMLVALRRQAASWTDLADDVAAAMALLGRPFSAAILVGLLAGAFLHTHPAQGFRLALVPVTVIASLRILLVVLPPESRRGLYWLTGLYCADALRTLLVSVPTLERLVFLAEAIVATTVYWGLLRSLARKGSNVRQWVRRGLILAVALTATAALCLIVGFVGLGRLLTGSTIGVAFIAFAFLAVARALSALLVIGLRTRLARRLNFVSRREQVVRRTLQRPINLLVLLLFVRTALQKYSILDPVIDVGAPIFSTPLTVGSLSISLGEVLVFVLTIWLSFQISKALRFVFAEDVFPRMKLPRGVPYAASNALHYAILLAGFFIAIMAAGVDLSRFAIIGGALGVGVGFGLQNVVNNFVSGLILLFERPVQVGDRVEVGTAIGSIERIGIRSSTLRTFDGAEIIVPNSNLISDQVTNWTLSDRRRRVIVPIGVAYGTDPQQVIDLLLGVAAAHEKVVDDPQAQALFTEHGDSSLNFELRVWTDNFDDWVRIRSEITVAVNQALAAADIEIPFPQRDLHIRSSDVPLGSAGRAQAPEVREA